MGVRLFELATGNEINDDVVSQIKKNLFTPDIDSCQSFQDLITMFDIKLKENEDHEGGKTLKSMRAIGVGGLSNDQLHAQHSQLNMVWNLNN